MFYQLPDGADIILTTIVLITPVFTVNPPRNAGMDIGKIDVRARFQIFTVGNHTFTVFANSELKEEEAYKDLEGYRNELFQAWTSMYDVAYKEKGKLN